MNRRILNFYYIISMLFLVFILFFAAYRLKITVDGNREASRKSLEALRISALSVYLAEGKFDTEYFKATMRDQFSATDRLLLLAIYSSEEGTYYLISRDQGYLVEPPGGGKAASWDGEPEYSIRPVYENRITLRFSPGIRQDLFIDGIFQDLDRGQLYPILREIFYVLLVYLLIASVFLLFAATAGGSESSPAIRDRPGRRTDRRPAREIRSVSSPSDPSAGLFSPSTGLGWSQHLPARLSSELERAAGSDQDLSLMLISSGARNIGHLAKPILEAFPLRDLVFEYDSCTAAVISPDRDLDGCLQEAQEFLKRSSSRSQPQSIPIGLSARNGRLVSANRLLTEAAQALRQAESSGGIIAFRADPDKYRAVAARSAVAQRSR